jgi:RNA-directed DNA polymerase
MVKDRVLLDIGAVKPTVDWESINWQSVDRRVRNLRRRIFRAAQNEQWNQVRSLMKLMLRSYSNTLQSVRKVTQENKGRKTPGLDGQVVVSQRGRVALVRSMLKRKAWKVSPAKRVYIPKSDGKQRPLGILTIKNRVAQAVVKNALEPCWEARFEQHSYGFRPGRSAHDAIEQCFRRLNKHCGDIWVLDADIKAAFDNISHDFVLQQLGNIPGRGLIRKWLKAGYVEAEMFNATASGVPQGGVISPLLANIAMDGIEALLPGKLGFIRYADDFVVTAKSKEQLEATLPALKMFLAERGLSLNTDKTGIRHINDGFNFLGFNVRRYGNKCLIKPQKDKTLAFLKEILEWLRYHREVLPSEVIAYLNPRLLGWSNYYRHAISKSVFCYVDHHVFRALWRWCCRRHSNKNRYWIANKYFGVDKYGYWCFHVFVKNLNGDIRKISLRQTQDIPITRHIKVKGKVSMDDPSLTSYWRLRAERLLERKATPGKRAPLRAMEARAD